MRRELLNPQVHFQPAPCLSGSTSKALGCYPTLIVTGHIGLSGALHKPFAHLNS
ncbi:hypothetical protein M404DRAFT_997822 [Pisolithus tinctorius Marx 270]|uniref:Uncharacterized protein n=1 Tax=Pisolithus tinctorius Marx 270 TaxID=870435 RepID=A0A0C3P3Q2_PISTI|nr:hypothetical protein M404DRAFT_997822 [Pisolithus tinctorius Marx 270]